MTGQPALGFRAFDVDEHYYEAPDAFIRHIDPSMKKRCMQWAEIDGRKRFMVAGKVNKFIPNPTFDQIAKPGSLEDYFRGRNLDGRDIAAMFGELDPLDDHPGFRNRDARVELMDRQGLESVLLFPTQGRGHAGGPQARHRSPARRLQRVQHLARRGLGLRP